MTKEQLQDLSAHEIADTLTTEQLAVLGRLSIVKHITELRGEKFAHTHHNAWIFLMSDLGILKEFENG